MKARLPLHADGAAPWLASRCSPWGRSCSPPPQPTTPTATSPGAIWTASQSPSPTPSPRRWGLRPPRRNSIQARACPPGSGPTRAGAISLGVPDLDGFIPLGNEGRPHIAGVVGRAEHIVIPQLNVSAEVEELSIINLASSAAYETPAFTVGHIPTTPNPGSAGNGWYFGHLENPLQGEGNVFLRLPEIADLLRDGEDVHVILTADGRDYLYLANGTSTVHADDLALYPSDDARISLVTCFPRLKYDHRLIVNAQLVAFRDAVIPEGA